MSQRLTESHKWPFSIPASEIRSPLGYRKNGQPILFIGGASPEGDPATGGGTGEGSSGSGEGSGSGSGGTGSEGQGKTGEENKGASDATISKAEYDKLEERMKAADRRASELEEWKKTKEREGLDEVERLKAESADKDKLLESASSLVERLTMEVAFLKSNTYTWHSPAAALKLLDRDGLEVKDGNVTGLDAALKKLADENPYLLKEAPKEGEGEKGNGGDGKTDPPPAGSKSNGDKRTGDKGKFDEADLRRRYPALNR